MNNVTVSHQIVCDDPAVRRIQIVAIVVAHCAAYIWPNQVDKQQAAVVAAEALHRRLPAKYRAESVCRRSRVTDLSRRAHGCNLHGVARMSLSSTWSSEEGEAHTTTGAAAAAHGSNHHSAVHRASIHGHDGVPVDELDAQDSSASHRDRDHDSLSETDELPLHISRISGGSTNELFHVYDAAGTTRSVVFRIFGKETDRIVARESEFFYQSLYLRTFVHGFNFMVYEYLSELTTLPLPAMKTEAAAIADALAEFHVRATHAARTDCGEPLITPNESSLRFSDVDSLTSASGTNCGSNDHVASDEAKYHRRGDKGWNQLCRYDREENFVTYALTNWVRQVNSDEIINVVAHDKRESYLHIAQAMARESAILLSQIDELLHRSDAGKDQSASKPSRDESEAKAGTVRGDDRSSSQRDGILTGLAEAVCHNDLLCGNIMYNPDTRDMRFIDFDFTRRSYLLFDVGNHFNEYCGIDCEYETLFPTLEHMRYFVTLYRASMRCYLTERHARGDDAEDEIIEHERATFWADSEAEEQVVVDEWTRLSMFFTVVSHLVWALWALVEVAVSKLDLNYLEYAYQRFERYEQTKKKFSETLFMPCSADSHGGHA